jgi:hypothetical protein
VEPDNRQSSTIFADESKRIAAAEKKLTWIQPSRRESEAPKVIRETSIYTDPEKIDGMAAAPLIDVAVAVANLPKHLCF